MYFFADVTFVFVVALLALLSSYYTSYTQKCRNQETPLRRMFRTTRLELDDAVEKARERTAGRQAEMRKCMEEMAVKRGKLFQELDKSGGETGAQDRKENTFHGCRSCGVVFVLRVTFVTAAAVELLLVKMIVRKNLKRAGRGNPVRRKIGIFVFGGGKTTEVGCMYFVQPSSTTQTCGRYHEYDTMHLAKIEHFSRPSCAQGEAMQHRVAASRLGCF